MAAKVELLQNQLMLANDRCNALHKKATSAAGNDAEHYADSLRRRCEELEKQLSDATAAKVFKKSEKSDKASTPPTSDEVTS
uniref:DCB domain-containing protein n=1 Tax=Panagrellus redivivus TaxID=6233 RepID=A0A7E4VUH2_PANRE